MLPSELDYSTLEGIGHGFRSMIHIQLLEDVGDVGLYRAFAYGERCRDILVG